MCGIIAIVRRRAERAPAQLPGLLDDLRSAGDVLADGQRPLRGRLEDAAGLIEAVDTELRGVPGVRALLDDQAGADAIRRIVADLDGAIASVESALDDPGVTAAGDSTESLEELEATNAALIRCKDALWAIGSDRLRAAREVAQLSPEDVAGEHETLNSDMITVEGSGEDFTAEGAAVLCGNIPTANATVYVIDTVMMPGA